MSSLAIQKRFGRDALPAAAFIATNIIIALVFVAFAMYYVLQLSLFDWNLISDNREFVGLNNYIEMFGDRVFRQVLFNSFYYVGVQVPVTMGIAVVLATLLNRAVFAKEAFRAIYFLPTILPVIAIAQVWIIIYEPNFGTLNWILGLFGIPRVNWLYNPATAMPAVIIFSVWRNVGFNMVIYLAALQDIPKMYYESASIDGASSLQKFFRITLPSLRPATFFILVTSIIGAFQVFGEIYVMTEGGPVNSTNVLAYYLYQQGFQFFNIGYASAIGSLLFIMLFGLTIAQWRFYARGED